MIPIVCINIYSHPVSQIDFHADVSTIVYIRVIFRSKELLLLYQYI